MNWSIFFGAISFLIDDNATNSDKFLFFKIDGKHFFSVNVVTFCSW